MTTNTTEPRWKQLQRGQALVEYWPTFPAAIAIMISAAILVQFINNSFLRTAQGLTGAGLCQTTDQKVSTSAQMYNHTIEASSKVYDPVTNRTTVSFTVTSGSQPSISHWVLGLPKNVADNVIQMSEAGSWTDADPTTGAKGIKFDTGYEAGGGSGGKGGKSAANTGLVLASYRAKAASTAEQTGTGITDTRVISMTLSGNYTFGAVDVTTKAGTDQVGTGTIIGPVAVIDESNSGNNNSTNPNGSC
jgi:hypothetical protein